MSSVRTLPTAGRLAALAIPAVAATFAASVALAPCSTGSTTPRATQGGARDARSPAPPPAEARRAQPARLPRATPVPILMYHVLGDPPPGAPFPQLYVTDRDFAGQMRWLARHGYTAVTLRSVWDHWQGRGIASAPAHRRVLRRRISKRCALRIPYAARPRLAGRAQSGRQEPVHPRRNQRKTGPKAHRPRAGRSTRTAAPMRISPPSAPANSLARSRALDGSSGGSSDPGRLLLLPGRQVRPPRDRAVRAAGFLAATTTVDGLASPATPFELRRVRVSRGDGILGFGAKVARLSAGVGR